MFALRTSTHYNEFLFTLVMFTITDFQKKLFWKLHSLFSLSLSLPHLTFLENVVFENGQIFMTTIQIIISTGNICGPGIQEQLHRTVVVFSLTLLTITPFNNNCQRDRGFDWCWSFRQQVVVMDENKISSTVLFSSLVEFPQFLRVSFFHLDSCKFQGMNYYFFVSFTIARKTSGHVGKMFI